MVIRPFYIFAATLGACATVAPCEFPVLVRVTPEADAECRALGVKRNDAGEWISDSATVRGCAPTGKIITDGSESNMGHEMKHQKEKNCP